jgi:hypothetical protein
MTTFNFPSLPGFGSSPEKRFAPEIISFAFYGRKPKIAGAVAKLRIVANSNPGIEVAPAPAPAPPAEPQLSLEEIQRREQIRMAVTGNDFLAPALQNDTSHADWMAKLDMMAGEDKLSELRRIVDEETDREYPRAA